jgi:simple sugar transport system substrate-binding protein
MQKRGITRRQSLQYAGVAGGGTALAAILAACGESKPKGPEEEEAAQGGGSGLGRGIKIRFFAGGEAGDAFASIVYNGAKAATAAYGPDVEYVFSGWDIERMQTQLRDAIAANPDGIAMMGHAGDDALLPLARQASEAGIMMMWQNVDVPKVREQFGGGYVGANLTSQGRALGEETFRTARLAGGDEAIVFGAWGEPGRDIREGATADFFDEQGMSVQRVKAPPETAADPNLLTPLVSSAFRRRPDSKVIVYSGGQTLGAVPQYMQAINKEPGEVTNVGFDLSPAIIDAFEKGWVQITSDQQPYLQGYLPILSLVLTKKYAFTGLNVDTGSGFVTERNFEPVSELVKKGIR